MIDPDNVWYPVYMGDHSNTRWPYQIIMKFMVKKEIQTISRTIDNL